MNNYGILAEAESAIRARYDRCVYCRKLMLKSGEDGWRGDWATIEHLNFRPPWNDPSTVVMCCWSCNSSRGAKPILVWFGTPYCREKGISFETVHPDVRAYIRAREEA